MGLVTVWTDKFCQGWDGQEETLSVIPLHESKEAVEALKKRYTTDAHFVPYHVVGQDVIPRINKVAIEHVPELRFDILVFDVDVPFEEDRDAIELLPWFETCGWYETKGGYRLLWELEESKTAEEYEQYFKQFRDQLRIHNIDVDENTSDWTRCYRLPRVVRGGIPQKRKMDLSHLGVLKWKPKVNGSVFSGIRNAQVPLAQSPDEIVTGGRNSFLTRMAGRYRRGGMSGEEILAALSSINETRCSPPLSDNEVQRIAQSVARYEPEPEAVEISDRLQLGSEVEIAERIVGEMKAETPTIFDRSRFWRYEEDNGCWESVDEDVVSKRVMKMDGHPVFVRVNPDGTIKTSPLKLSNTKVRGSVKCMATLAREDEFFKGQSFGVAMKNGFFNGLDLIPQSEDNRATFRVPFNMVDNEPEQFMEILRTCLSSEDDVQLLREFVGACLTGHVVNMQQALVFLGSGANGKSSVLKILSELFGEEYVSAIPPQEMEQEYRRAMLARARFNVVNEMPEADILSGESIKAIISGDTIIGREIRKSPFAFQPKCGHVFSANALPSVNDASPGFWRRWVVLRFDHVFGKNERRQNIVEEVVNAELESIASWCLQSVPRLLERGSYHTSEETKQSTHRWRKDAEQIAVFLEDQDEGEHKAGALYQAYRAWAMINGHYPMSNTKFGRRLGIMGIHKVRKTAGFVYQIKPGMYGWWGSNDV